MIFFYEILFSIQVKVDNVTSKGFTILPTAECSKKLNRLGMLFKKLEDRSAVIVENIGEDRISSEPIRKIKKTTGFTFLLYLDDLELLGKIAPYKRNSPFPPYSGRARKLYFDNLNFNIVDDSFVIQDNRNLLSSGNTVNDSDLGSVTLNKFSYTETDVNVPLPTLTFREINPVGESIRPYAEHPFPDPARKTVQLDLKNGAYQLTRGINQEVMYADSSLVGSNALGIVQIFKDENVDYGTKIEYEISFSTT